MFSRLNASSRDMLRANCSVIVRSSPPALSAAPSLTGGAQYAELSRTVTSATIDSMKDHFGSPVHEVRLFEELAPAGFLPISHSPDAADKEGQASVA
jgi:hypothetical protein